MQEEKIHCERCNSLFEWDERVEKIISFWNWEIFKGKQKPFGWSGFCFECAKHMTPFIYALRDIYELNSAVNKLERIIYEKKRNKNNRTT